MFIEQRQIGSNEERRITFTSNVILTLIFIFLFFSFWNLQVLKKDHYSLLSTQNILKEVEIKAPRGIILDRNGKILAENRLSFNLFIIRENVKDLERSAKAASELTGLSVDIIKERINNFRNYPGFYKILLKRDLDFKKVIFLESRSDIYPEFTIDQEPARRYPFGSSSSHILGHMAELSPNEFEIMKKEGYSLGDMSGVSGVEKTYEAELRGVNGSRTVIRDNLGQIQKTVDVEEPEIGESLVLTIDIELQKFIEELYKDYNGAAGVVDLKTGGLVAMVSKPNFDPGFFSSSFTEKEWVALINDENKPLHNKFIQGLYSPGSTFKIVMAVAGLNEKIITTRTNTTCYGSRKIYDRVFHCWNRRGHGSVNLIEAIQNSCNIYFYQLGKNTDIDIIAGYGVKLGLGKPTLIDLPNENKGLLPSRKWKLDNLGEKWYPGETISVAIGGGMITSTPAQLLSMISTIALRGKKPQIHLMREIRRNGDKLKEYLPAFEKVNIPEEIFETVIEGLYKSVNEEGTGRGAMVEGLDICGKTGTQLILSLENPDYKELVKKRKFTPHSWFVSFAPRNNPRYASVIFVENGGDAGRIAAPIAGKIYRRLFESE
ncbi:MAG: penicillin-binding protein 2 [Candidatus Aminicenantes bacterium]|nr:penicillin-binding protein 2 [Candidatus Aminicenantes bacterium]